MACVLVALGLDASCYALRLSVGNPPFELAALYRVGKRVIAAGPVFVDRNWLSVPIEYVDQHVS